MKKGFRTAMVALVIAMAGAATSIANAQALIEGTVTKIDTGASKITIRHGPIKKLDMDEGMTMVFTAKDTSLLSKVKAGDKVKFDADNVNGQFVVTKIDKAK